MGKKSVRTGVDIRRLANAVSSPGIDPRQWLVKAIVTDIGFDPAHGIFADIQVMPDGEPETVLVGTRYAGDDFGEYCPIKIGDTVLVGFTNGDPGEGGVIISRLWSGSEKPPKELSAGDLGEDGGDVTSDPTFRIENGATMRIVGKEGASYKIELDGDATFEIVGTSGTTVIIDGDAGVRLGKPTLPATYLGVARQTDTVLVAGVPPAPIPGAPVPEPALALLLWSIAVNAALLAGVPVAVPPLAPTIGTISSSSTKVKAE